MFESLRKQIVTLSASAGALTVATTTLAAFVGSVSHEDGLVYSEWIDPAPMTEPIPGQFYVISAEGEIREPLCSLTEGDFAPRDDRQPGVTLVNRLGEAMRVIQSSLPYDLEWPAVELRYVPMSDLLVHNGRILEQRDLAALAKQLSAKDFAEISRLESCAQAIVTSLKNGLQICQLTEVATDQATNDRLGVDFASLCLASQTDTEPRPLPDLNDHSMWTAIKSSIGLIERRPGGRPAVTPPARAPG